MDYFVHQRALNGKQYEEQLRIAGKLLLLTSSNKHSMPQKTRLVGMLTEKN